MGLENVYCRKVRVSAGSEVVGTARCLWQGQHTAALVLLLGINEYGESASAMQTPVWNVENLSAIQ